ncbi:uncharacterized protein LOC135096049 [Scylla paramamosain]|uniref:uncharacterized protein LOC135096049 n=1 Tax=Scylla paramamosain TaxID=85552 RepID=UPI003082B935
MTYHLLRMKQCPMLVPTLLCCRGVYVLQAELCSKKSYKTSSSNEIVKVPGTCFVQPAPAPAAPSPARPCSDESAVGFPALERELPSLSGHLQYSLEANTTLHHKLQNKWYFRYRHAILLCPFTSFAPWTFLL